MYFVIASVVIILIVGAIVIHESGAFNTGSKKNHKYTDEKKQMVDYINENCDLDDLIFMDDLGEGTVEGDQPVCVYSKDNTISGYGFNYPTKESHIMLTQIDLKEGSNHHILGIHVGDSVETAREMLTNDDFKEKKTSTFREYTRYPFEKDGVVITIYATNKNGIEWIHINIE